MENAAERKKPLVRFGEFEFLKALAIIGLPIVHVMEELTDASMASASLESFSTGILGLCAFGPSVFMICMGFGIGGGKSSSESVTKTGIQFLIIGAILNIVRWFIPGLIHHIVNNARLMDEVELCLQSDIYYFAGIFFIFYGLLKRWKVSTSQLLLISIGTLTLNGILTPFMQKHVTDPVIISIIGNIIYIDKTSCFPLLSWSIFPTVGIIFGEVLKKNDDAFREVFMRRVMDFSIVFLIAFVFFLWNYNIDAMKVLVSPNNDYITDLPNVIMLVCLACFLIGIVYYLCKAIGHTKFMEFMLKISAFIIPFYLLQWLLVSWMVYTLKITRLPKHSFGIPAYWIAVVLITAICIFVSSHYGMRIMKVILKYTTFKKRKKKTGGKTDAK